MTRIAIEKWEAEHRKHVNAFLSEIDMLYDEAIDELVRIGMGYDFNDLSGKPFSFTMDKVRANEAKSITDSFRHKLNAIITVGVSTEWAFANEKNDTWVKQLFSNPRNGYMQHNLNALDAFLNRKIYGHKLSARVWNYAKQFEQFMEMALSVNLAEGRSAASISRDVRSQLKYPDKLFRRVRDKYGNLQLSKNARAFHPGQGVYRSSYQNAMRMARTEINMAYRQSDHQRWQQLDFIVGVEVKVSKSHEAWLAKEWRPRFKKGVIPPQEICDALAGKYPKDFKFIGWHPNCKCYAVPILANEGTGKDWWEEPENEVGTTPPIFDQWMRDNKDRIDSALERGKAPYWVTENAKYALKDKK